MTNAPSPFSPLIPHWQTTFDSTSLGWLKTCPRSYYYQMILGYQPRSRNIHLVFGGLYAGALERYAHSRAGGATHDAATLRMVRWAMEESGEYVCAPDCEICEGTGKHEVFDGSLQSHGTVEEPCENATWAPWTPTEPDANIKNRYTLIRALVWNAEDRLSSPFRTHILANGKPAVELSFTLPVAEIEGEVVSLSGHLDEVVEEREDPASKWIRDDKTSKHTLDASYFTRYTPDNQMSLYSFAGKIILDVPIRGVLVKAAQMQVGGSRFRTQPIPRPQAVLDEWFNDTLYYIRQARAYAEVGHWPMNDKACYLCAFKKVCAVSPSHRMAHLAADFEKRVWNPLQARGDI